MFYNESSRPISEAVEKLREAVKYLEHGWCRTNFAENRWKMKTSPLSSTACRWCAAGAILAAHGYTLQDTIDDERKHWHVVQCMEVIRSVVNMWPKGFYGWNDDPAQTQQNVINTFNKAIERHEKN